MTPIAPQGGNGYTPLSSASEDPQLNIEADYFFVIRDGDPLIRPVKAFDIIRIDPQRQEPEAIFRQIEIVPGIGRTDEQPGCDKSVGKRLAGSSNDLPVTVRGCVGYG